MLANSYQNCRLTIPDSRPPCVPPTNRRALILLWISAATFICILAATAQWPDLELALAHTSIRVGRDFDHLGIARNAARGLPPILLLLACVALVLSVRSGRLQPAQAAVRIAVLFATFALGPGLLVNGLLKSQSHRPRPVQTIEVSGAGQAYRPFYAFDGGCVRNCSFSSGEAAAAFWTVAPALMTPPGLQIPAVAGALIFGSATGGLRMFAGAHYLSDVAFSGLAMIVLIACAIRLARRAPGIMRGRDSVTTDS